MTDDDIKRMHLETTGFDLDASESALIDFARAIEQASRRAALEEAAHMFQALGKDLVAMQIRALATETNNG
jgi:hypothetical protein